MPCGERQPVRIGDRPLHVYSVDRIRTVQYDHVDAGLRGLLHRVPQRADVGVEPATDVLDVENERIQPLKLLRFRPHGLAVEAVDRQSGLLVRRVLDPLVHRAADSMLRAEKRLELYPL